MARVFAITVLVCLAAMSPACAMTAWSQWYGNGHYYQAVHTPDGITWEDAKNAAEAMGGYLATIHSDEENNFVYHEIADARFWNAPDSYGNSEGPWLGGHRSNGDYYVWIWANGEDWIYTNWSGGEPNNSGSGEDSLIYFGPGGPMNKVWNDVSGSYLAAGYVVEVDALPEPSGVVALVSGLVGLSGFVTRRRSY